MKEKIKTVYESLLIVTGYTRQELSERYSVVSDKRLAQNVLIRILLKSLTQADVARLTGINGNAISHIKSTEPSRIESIVFQAVWNLYTMLMGSQVSVKTIIAGNAVKVKQLINKNTPIITLGDIRKKIKRPA